MDNLQRDDRTVRRMALFFTASLLAAAPLGALYTGQLGELLPGLLRLWASPCPYAADSFALGGLGPSFLNVGLCGAAFLGMIYALDAPSETGSWAGYLLVVAHAFFGLNFVNMWPPIFGIWLYCRRTGASFRDNIAMAMLSTAFGPFMSELFFRYPLPDWAAIHWVEGRLNLLGVLGAFLLGAFLGFTIPAMLPGAQALHKGFVLYNGGLAFGLLGILVHGLLYNTMGVASPQAVSVCDPVYAAAGRSYFGFCNLYLLAVLGSFLFYGWLINGRSFAGYGRLLEDTGRRADFIQEYGPGCVYINLGLHGLLLLAYMDGVILLTEGVGFTGPTLGVLLAALSFTAGGQHPKNVWPILAGFGLLWLAVFGLYALGDRSAPWTLSTQGYINGVALGTGLCPFAGCYGKRAGILAGVICAAICTSVSVIHGGLVLYNGGMSAGFTALILTPLLDHYYTGTPRS